MLRDIWLSMRAVLLAAAIIAVLLALGAIDARPQNLAQSCQVVTWVGPNGRTLTCTQCYYEASGQIVVSNCTGG